LVSGVAQAAGVPNHKQGIFHEQRYLGLYEAKSADVKQAKGLKPGDNIFDVAGPLELSAHDFQMALAADVIANKAIRGEQAAIRENLEVAKSVRKNILERGGTLPESLPLVEHIADVRKRVTGRRTKSIPKG
jgi:DNA-damage-inducible protein D